MKDKEKQEKVFDILNKFEFFQGQRAGRELWNDKPKEVQDKDISDFIKGINYIRSYLQDSVVLSREELSKKYVSRDTYDSEIEYRKVLEKRERKKIVKEILQEIRSYYPIDKEHCNDGELFILNLCEDIASRYGVKVAE